MNEFLFQTYMVALPIILTTVLGYVVWILKQQKKDRDANSKGTMLLLKVQLIEYHAEWTTRGYVTRHGIDNFIEMYNAYHELGGNGMITHLKEDVEKLPIKNWEVKNNER